MRACKSRTTVGRIAWKARPWADRLVQTKSANIIQKVIQLRELPCPKDSQLVHAKARSPFCGRSPFPLG